MKYYYCDNCGHNRFDDPPVPLDPDTMITVKGVPLEGTTRTTMHFCSRACFDAYYAAPIIEEQFAKAWKPAKLYAVQARGDGARRLFFVIVPLNAVSQVAMEAVRSWVIKSGLDNLGVFQSQWIKDINIRADWTLPEVIHTSY